MRPRIAINCDLQAEAGSGRSPRSFLYLDYLDYIAEAGGLPVVIPPVPGAAELLDGVDGLLLTGGDDYRLGLAEGDAPEPLHFVAIPPRREASDIELLVAARRRRLPTLGICAGFQLQVLLSGGEVYGDLESERGPGDVRHRRDAAQEPLPRHAVEWLDSSERPAVAAGHYEVNSQHHQAVRRLPDDWSPLARAPDGVVEAAVGPGPLELGVQWHPEKSRDEPLSQRMIAALITAARLVLSGGSPR